MSPAVASSEREEKKAAREAAKARDKELRAKEEEANRGRTGKGLRTFFGMTRGKNPQEISYEGFDESLPETLPLSIPEFVELTGIPKSEDGERQVMNFLIEGYNEVQYTAASDPVAEFVDAAWPVDVQKQFRLAVRNYSNAANISIEDAAELLKPGIVKGLGK